MASSMVAKTEKSIFFNIYKSHSIPVIKLSNFCRFSNEMMLFLRKNKSFFFMDNNLKYAVSCTFYGSIGSFYMVLGDAKPSENVMLLQVLLLYSSCCIHTKVK